VQSMPTTLYVEGISPSWPRADTLWLSYKKDGDTIHTDTVNFTVVPVDLFRNAPCTASLDDWPKSGNNPRSPKYIFGEDDPIYVQVANLGTDPYTAETKNAFVKVTSESDTSGIIKLTLKETGVNTQTFRNLEELGELLYLSTSSSEAAKDKIKVIDEEVLTFSLEIQPGSDNYVTCKTVKVDRGEYAGCGLDSFFNNITKFKDQMEESDVDWFGAGYVEYPDDVGSQSPCPMKTFIEDAGSDTDDNKEADFMAFVCHGDLNGDLKDNDSPAKNLIMSAPNAAIWGAEVE